MTDPDDIVVVPTSDVLDLHTYRPEEVVEVTRAYLDACVAAQLQHVRIVHGKGRGTQRHLVHQTLERHPAVVSFRLADETAGAWGATLVTLRRT